MFYKILKNRSQGYLLFLEKWKNRMNQFFQVDFAVGYIACESHFFFILSLSSISCLQSRFCNSNFPQWTTLGSTCTIFLPQDVFNVKNLSQQKTRHNSHNAWFKKGVHLQLQDTLCAISNKFHSYPFVFRDTKRRVPVRN